MTIVFKVLKTAQGSELIFKSEPMSLLEARITANKLTLEGIRIEDKTYAGITQNGGK
jgi:hypothetical protein